MVHPQCCSTKINTFYRDLSHSPPPIPPLKVSVFFFCLKELQVPLHKLQNGCMLHLNVSDGGVRCKNKGVWVLISCSDVGNSHMYRCMSMSMMLESVWGVETWAMLVILFVIISSMRWLSNTWQSKCTAVGIMARARRVSRFLAHKCFFLTVLCSLRVPLYLCMKPWLELHTYIAVTCQVLLRCVVLLK